MERRLMSEIKSLKGTCKKCNACDYLDYIPSSGGGTGSGSDRFNERFFGGRTTGIIDPSGYVYEAVSSNRLEGVKATCYEKVTKYDIHDEPYEQIESWDASVYGQQNPLTTDTDGYYAWDVPKGSWQVRYEKEGYEPAASEWMEVPPPHFDVDIGLVSHEEPALGQVRAYPDEINLVFSRYIKVDSVAADAVQIIVSGTKVTGVLKPVDEEASPTDGFMLAEKFRFIPDTALETGAQIEVSVARSISTYADIRPDKKLTASATVVLKPETLKVTDQLALDYNGEGTVSIAADPAEATAGMCVSITGNDGGILGIQDEKVTLDSEGKA